MKDILLFNPHFFVIARYSMTIFESTTFTITHARQLASKVATDLKRMQRFYESPDDFSIQQYEKEITLLLKYGYLDNITYGFRKDVDWITPTLRYTAQNISDTSTDDDPGRIKPGADISGASFYSFLTNNSEWQNLTCAERDRFKSLLPFIRGTANEPGVKGYFSNDLSYLKHYQDRKIADKEIIYW